ncbi:MAG TPA: hypothetical protein VH723_04695 [Candidatus Limnocylindrales bacterium]|jgi:hypothetical protein
MARVRARRAVALAFVVALGGLVPGASAATPFDTAEDAMLTAVAPRGWVDPIITVGDMVGTYRFDAIPDGIAIRSGTTGTAQVYVNHELSTVPFPYTPSGPTEANSQNDFGNAKLSKLTINTAAGTVAAAATPIGSGQGFQRFCSSFLAGPAQGFSRELLLTNEEAVDWVNRTGASWPATEGADNARQAGVVVAHDVRTGATRPIWGLGRLNHENSLAVPGYNRPVVLTGDDTFVNSPSQSQLYQYLAVNADALWNDTGNLFAFVSDDPTKQKYEDFPRGSTASVTGHFIRIPKLIATGRNPDGTDVMSTDAEAALGVPAGTYAPPTDGSFSRPPGATSGPSVDGPQWVLERWSQLHGVFRFIRLEDMAYDKRPGMANVVYLVDSGRGSAGAVADGKSTNGRIWKMVLSKTNPTLVTSMSILIEGDDNEVKTRSEMHQPDNIESTVNGLYFTEDPGSSQQFNFTDQLNDPRRTEARIWQYRLSTGALRVVAKVDQSADEGPTDVDAAGRGNLGAWEASGIVDASRWFGPGTFLVTVQAHTLWVAKDGPSDGTGREGQAFTYKREGGQLVILHIPGA